VASELLKLVEAGIRVFFYATGEELKLDTPIAKITLSLKGFAAEDYRHQIKTKTREAMRAKAARGYVAGGKVLGYSNVRDGSNVRHVINESQAAIGRRIFELCAEGKGLLKIAKRLNEDGISNPTGQDRLGSKKAGKWWSSTGIREILHRERYRGRIIYGKTRWQDKGGQKVKIDMPESEWSVREQPELRIVTEELWQAAHTRLDNAHHVYLRRNNGQLNGKPESGLESKHLLSGFLRCKVCGGVMQINKRTSKRGRPQLVYVCATHRTRGNAACPEKSGLSAASIHEGVVFSLRKVLTPERLDALRKTWAEDRPDHEAKRRPIQAELARIDAELKKLGDAVAGGASVQTLLDAVKAREAERRELLAQLEHLDGLAKAAASYDGTDHLAAWKIILPGWSKALIAEGPAGRQRLRSILRGPVYVSKGTDGVWRFEGHGTLGVSSRVGWGSRSGMRSWTR
jgi:site-specific DNA recombinase